MCWNGVQTGMVTTAVMPLTQQARPWALSASFVVVAGVSAVTTADPRFAAIATRCTGAATTVSASVVQKKYPMLHYSVPKGEMCDDA